MTTFEPMTELLDIAPFAIEQPEPMMRLSPSARACARLRRAGRTDWSVHVIIDDIGDANRQAVVDHHLDRFGELVFVTHRPYAACADGVEDRHVEQVKPHSFQAIVVYGAFQSPRDETVGGEMDGEIAADPRRDPPRLWSRAPRRPSVR